MRAELNPAHHRFSGWEMTYKTTAKALIVDDSKVIRTILSRQLGHFGYYCDMASNGIEALQSIENGNYDLILLDINIPHISGIEVLRRIKHKYVNLPVIMVSALNSIDPVRMAFQGGAFDYVTKPWNVEKLQFAVARAIKHGRLAKENTAYHEAMEKKVEERAQELTEALAETRKTYQTTILALGSALETRDIETQAHSLRVSCYSTLLAAELGINNTDQMIDIERGAYLHDIGKIGVPDHILKKSDSLTPEEWKIMKRHPEVGKKMIEGINFLSGAVKTVLYHHEHYNGSGYPSGVKDENIPIEARIFAVADAFDTLISGRPYREAVSASESREIIRSDSGTQFDPKVVCGFEKIAESILHKVAVPSGG